jgi:hypothetical protein
MRNRKKIKIIGLVLYLILLFNGCGDKKVEYKKKVTIDKGIISNGVIIGQKLKDYSFSDQFDKLHKLTNKVKKVIFVFTKPTGHLMRVYLSDKEEHYLSTRNIDFIADVSKMPSIIFKMFALPDLKDSKYPIMIIKDATKSKRFRNEKNKNSIMMISLDNKIVKNVKFVTTKADLKNELD